MVKTRIVIDISDAKVSDNPSEVLVTYSLGSCIGVCLYDPGTRIGGMLHYQLPSSTMDPARAQSKPFMFADTGMKLLVDKLLSMGANSRRLQVRLAGGASMATGPQGFDIGKCNYLAIRKILWSHGLIINAEDVGGNSARNLYLDMGDGTVTVRSSGLEKTLR
ncbi:MAG: chemotaxis protein CheD [Phycisphaerae bacterium]|nr:chemotaxis protein CheD [Phycisphaerae bacterium]